MAAEPRFKPYRPPWYPYDDDPWAIVSSLSGDVVSRYIRWERSLPDGELLRLIREYQASEETKR